MIVDENRLEYIQSLLVEIKPHLRHLIARDPQFLAIRDLSHNRGVETASILVVSNALISYQLSIEGEKYWRRFSDYFSRANVEVSINSFKKFLYETGCIRNLNQKLNRLNRFISSKIADRLASNGLYYCERIRDLIEELGHVLKTDKYAKTLVFAAKMYGYLCIANNVEPSWTDIPIPVDYRNAKLSITSCIIKYDQGEKPMSRAKNLTSGYYSRIIQQTWERICHEIETPCIELDTFTWLFVGVATEAKFNPALAKEIFYSKYGVDISLELCKALLECVTNV